MASNSESKRQSFSLALVAKELKKKQAIRPAIRMIADVLSNFLSFGGSSLLGLGLLFHADHINICKYPAGVFVNHDFFLLANFGNLLWRDDNVTALSSTTNNTHNRQSIRQAGPEPFVVLQQLVFDFFGRFLTFNQKS